MQSERASDFNNQLSQWVAKQGFWFQVRYSMSGDGLRGAAAFHFLSIILRVLIFLLVASVIGWAYLAKRTDSRQFSQGVQDSLKAGLSASNAEMRGLSRVQGQLGIQRLACEGGDQTFFTTLEARVIRCKMGFFDGIIGKWDPGTISIFRLVMDLRAGADDADSAKKLSDALFKKIDKIDIKSLEVANTTLRWGYSDRTYGSIVNSNLKVQRLDDGLKLIFKGGTFSQNWLKNLEIVNLTVVCNRDGLVFEAAELKQDQGTIDLSGLRVLGGERPRIDGTAKIRRLSLESALPRAARGIVSGSISGDFQIYGSTNSADGVGFSGQVVLDGKDTITVRDRLHLLKALSIVDYERNYNRIDFREGSFQIKTIADGMAITGLKLKSDDLFSLEGKLSARAPTSEEARVAVGKDSSPGGSPLFSNETQETEESVYNLTEPEMDLEQAAEASKRGKDASVVGGASASLFDRLGISYEMRRMEEKAAERISKLLRYEGSFVLTLPKGIFERAPRLAALYPLDRAVDRIPLTVPINGSIYDITLQQAEDLYQQGSR